MFDGIPQLPDPPPGLADCDLRGLPYFPQLRSLVEDSELLPRDARDMMELLYDRACRSTPGASLPNNLRALARIADTTQPAIRRRMAVFTEKLELAECADGRLYVGIAVPVVTQRWEKHLSLSARGMRGATKRWQPTPARPRENEPSTDGRPPVNGVLNREKTDEFNETSMASVSVTKKEMEKEHTHPTAFKGVGAAPLRSAGACVFDKFSEGKKEPEPGPVAEADALEGIGMESIPTAEQKTRAEPPAPPPRRPEPSRADFDALAACWPNREALEAAWPVLRAALKADPELTADMIRDAAGRHVDAVRSRCGGDAAATGRFAGQLRYWLRDRRWRDWDALQATTVDLDPPSEVDWRSQMIYWTNPARGGPTRARWEVLAWGPMPGDPGCRVPKHLLHVRHSDATLSEAPPSSPPPPLPRAPSVAPPVIDDVAAEAAFEAMKAAATAEFWADVDKPQPPRATRERQALSLDDLISLRCPPDIAAILAARSIGAPS